MHIETQRLVLRELQISDAAPLAQIWSDPDVTKFMGGPRDEARLRQDLEDEAESAAASRIDLWPVVEKASGEVIGHCGLLEKEVDGQAEIELIYVFGKAAWGQGYATEAAMAVREYAFEQLGLRRLIALIDPGNAASERVALKAGFRYEKETRRPSGKFLRVYAAHCREESIEGNAID
jgi:ribosomal-protein-alanine N-acetyltransferase